MELQDFIERTTHVVSDAVHESCRKCFAEYVILDGKDSSRDIRVVEEWEDTDRVESSGE